MNKVFPFIVSVVLLGSSCSTNHETEIPGQTSMPARDINDVLRDHDDRIMAISGVVGIYVGLLEDDKTPCLKVMIAEMTPEVEKQIPKSLEGHPVVAIETGPIRPLGDQN